MYQGIHHWCREEECEVVGFLTLCFQKMTVAQLMIKGSEHYIVRVEVCVPRKRDVLDVVLILPEGILSNVWFAGWNNNIMTECHLLTALSETVVAINIHQRSDSITTWCYTLNYKMSTRVSSCHTSHDGISLGIQSYEYTFNGLNIAGIEHIATNLKGIYSIARGESV